MHIGSWVGIATSDDVNRRLVSTHPSCVLGRYAARIGAPTRFTKTLKCDLYPVPIQWSGCSWEFGDIHKIMFPTFEIQERRKSIVCPKRLLTLAKRACIRGLEYIFLEILD